MNKWIDVHCHLNFLDVSPQEAVDLALQNGVERLITIGTCAKDHVEVVQLAQSYAPYVFGTLGVHPHDAESYDESTEAFMLAHLNDPRIVSVAEIGLDYYYDNSPREQQQKVFRRQLEIAREHNLPVEIHTRDAEEDTVRILSEFGGKVRGLIHCFTGSQWLADEAIRLGLNVSFSGIVTFKKAEELRNVCKSVPLDRLHVETDAPFLAPVPKRGQKNRPDFVIHTAEFVAQLKGISVDKLATVTRENALSVFQKLDW